MVEVQNCKNCSHFVQKCFIELEFNGYSTVKGKYKYCFLAMFGGGTTPKDTTTMARTLTSLLRKISVP